MFSKKKTLKTKTGQGRARESIQICFLKKNSEKIFPGKGQGKGEYSDLFSKRKTVTKYSLGKGRARESIQICVLQ